MKKFIIFLIVFCPGCVFQNPYKTFYQDRTGGIDITKSRTVILPTGDPKIFLGEDVDQDVQKMSEDGYSLLGFSSFNAGDDGGKNNLIAQAKRVKAEIAISYSRYSHTESGVFPLVLPDDHTVTTTYSGTGNTQGNIYGSGGRCASYNGTSNSYGQATTTIYGSQTTYIPYSRDHYNYFASYWIKRTYPVFGVIAVDLTSEQRAKIGTNKGAYVNIVVKGSPAFMADIFNGDIITKISNDDVIDAKNLSALESKYFGKRVFATIIRGEETLTKEIQFSEGDKVQDEKYGSIARSYYVFRNPSPKLVKTALINFDLVFDAYHKSKIYGFTFEECRANPDKGEDPRAVAIFDTINAVISDYGKKNQYRAIFSHKLPNICENEDITEEIILILNKK